MIAFSGKKLLLACIIAPIILGFTGYTWLRVVEAKESAARAIAYGRLSQLRAALLSYEYEHGELPQATLRDSSGNPLHSWRAMILPYLDGELGGFSKQLDYSQPWDSETNTRKIDSIADSEWVWFTLTKPHTRSDVRANVFAYLGNGSLWESASSISPQSQTESRVPVLLIWIWDSDLHPLQPGDISEEALHVRVERGEEVLFMAAGDGHQYGVVGIDQGQLVFPTWQQALDRRENRGQ